MKRASLLLSAVLLIAGCGNTPTEKRALDPQAEVLRFFPAGKRIVALVNTDSTIENLRQLVRSAQPIPGWASLSRRVGDLLRASHLSVQRQIAPLLGNELAVGAGSLGRMGSGSPLVVLETEDPAQLNQVARRAVAAGSVREEGRFHGARLFSAPGSAVATRDGVVVIGLDTTQLREALKIRDGPQTARLNDDDVGGLLDQLPPEAPVHVYVDLRGILDTRLAPDAKRRLESIPWVAALDKAGVAFERSGAAATLTFLVRTDRASLADSDLPIAPGVTPPTVHSVLPGVSLGLTEASQTRHFLDRLGTALGHRSGLIARGTRLVDRAQADSGHLSRGVPGAAGSLAAEGRVRGLLGLLPSAVVAQVRRLPVMPVFTAYAEASTNELRGRLELLQPGAARSP